MFEEEMKVGPKGQVVIPQPLRKTLGIHAGSKIVFKLEEGKLFATTVHGQLHKGVTGAGSGG